MIYTVQKDNQVFEIDDNIFFDKQPKGFRDIYLSAKQGDVVEMDNCYVIVLKTGRIMITIKEENNE